MACFNKHQAKIVLINRKRKISKQIPKNETLTFSVHEVFKNFFSHLYSLPKSTSVEAKLGRLMKQNSSNIIPGLISKTTLFGKLIT